MYRSRCYTRINFRASFFLVYINDLATNLKSNFKLFNDDTSLFSIVSDPLLTANILNKYLEKGWAEQWKMALNPDQQSKLKKKNLMNLFILISALIIFLVEIVQTQKHLRIRKKDNLKDKFARVNGYWNFEKAHSDHTIH